jgi:hypothetical protein
MQSASCRQWFLLSSEYHVKLLGFCEKKVYTGMIIQKRNNYSVFFNREEAHGREKKIPQAAKTGK